jgi:hypothetical protein
MIERENCCEDVPSIIGSISVFLKRDTVLVGLLTLALIIGFAPCFDVANSETKSRFPLKELRSQMAEHRPFWTEPQRSKLINAVQSAFEGKAVDNMETRVQTLAHFFPSYLLELPGQIVDDELEFLCRRTQWHIERFLSNPLPRPKDVSNLRSQVKSLILIIQDQEGDTTLVIPPALKEKATRILLETVTKVAQNPLLPALKRPLTISELATAKADILKWLRETKGLTHITADEDELLQWHLNRIAVVIQIVDAITRADAPQSLVEMEQKYLRSVRTRKRLEERFEAGHRTFLSMLSPSVETIAFMEFFFRESFALYRATFSTQFQFLIGY